MQSSIEAQAPDNWSLPLLKPKPQSWRRICSSPTLRLEMADLPLHVDSSLSAEISKFVCRGERTFNVPSFLSLLRKHAQKRTSSQNTPIVYKMHLSTKRTSLKKLPQSYKMQLHTKHNQRRREALNLSCRCVNCMPVS